MSEAPEFSRPVRLDTLGPSPRRVSIEAEAGERAALAERFGLVSIERLVAEADVSLSGETVTVAGTLEAAVTQSCVASGEPVPETVELPFRIEFRPHPEVGGDEKIELGESELDVVFYDGAAVDLGDTAAETLSLNVDPYPRSPAAEAALREAGVRTEEEAKAEASPFAGLASLKDKLVE